MVNRDLIIVVNPGSTSTKVALFGENGSVLQETVAHDRALVAASRVVYEQYEWRMETILKILEKLEGWQTRTRGVVGRGGLLHPLPGGTYLVNDDMVEDLKVSRYGDHPSNLGAPLAKGIADKLGVPAFIVDSVMTDELWDIARISGYAEIQRVSTTHALNIKATARRRAEQLNKPIEDTSFVVCHLGGGISVVSLKGGKIVDMNNALLGEGTFSPERVGTLPVRQLIDLCFSGKFASAGEMKHKLVKEGGLYSYLKTNDLQKIEQMIADGDKKADLVFSAMAFQIAKAIGGAACALSGKMDGILISGGAAQSKVLIERILERIKFLGPVYVHAGEGELESLAQGAARVLDGVEEAKTYARISE
ncbi:MAG TPA: butyrate kinase [bacterium]|nr:butyrate kinase [bacterium]